MSIPSMRIVQIVRSLGESTYIRAEDKTAFKHKSGIPKAAAKVVKPSLGASPSHLPLLKDGLVKNVPKLTAEVLMK